MKKIQGFTLVELAIVMIVIGLLIGGVLKGQELVKNSQITGTIAQVHALTGATQGFKDAYRGLPGDLRQVDALAKIPNCAVTRGCDASRTPARLGNGRIEPWWASNAVTNPFDPNHGMMWGAVPPLDEAYAFFIQLNLTNYISSFDGSNGPHIITKLKQTYLTPQYYAHPGAPAGNYFRVMNINGTGSISSRSLSPAIAARFDQKMDDGNPVAGSVRADTTGGCTIGTEYDEKNTAATACPLFIYIGI